MLENKNSNSSIYKYVWFIGMVLFVVSGIMYAVQGDSAKSIACNSFSLACCANLRVSLLESEKR
ncbi:MAG: hypothetical protein J6N95_06740 [Bacilli bacterium]|nr:hypothetical protein [Bacilli bacterium]